jgi:peptidyl-prolyl cis-trans isomerase-like 1
MSSTKTYVFLSFLIQKKFVKLITTVGEIEIELYYEHAPKTCYNFGALAEKGYYDNTIFHRIIKGKNKSK